MVRKTTVTRSPSSRSPPSWSPYFPDPSPLLLGQLSIYLELLLKWNAQTNLTAIRAPEEIVRRHFGESLFAALHVPQGAKNLLDLGSGAGFPGLPIQLALPPWRSRWRNRRTRKQPFCARRYARWTSKRRCGLNGARSCLRLPLRCNRNAGGRQSGSGPAGGSRAPRSSGNNPPSRGETDPGLDCYSRNEQFLARSQSLKLFHVEQFLRLGTLKLFHVEQFSPPRSVSNCSTWNNSDILKSPQHIVAPSHHSKLRFTCA